MTLEGHAEQVEHFPLQPVGRFPDPLQSVDLGIVSIELDLGDEAVPVAVAVEVTDDPDQVLFRVVGGSQILKEIEVQGGIALEKAADLDDPGARENAKGILLGRRQRSNGAPELLRQPLVNLLEGQRGHRLGLRQATSGTSYPDPVPGRLGRIFVFSFSREISSWTRKKPSVNASGRGGQPGTYTSTGMILSTPFTTE